MRSQNNRFSCTLVSSLILMYFITNLWSGLESPYEYVFLLVTVFHLVPTLINVTSKAETLYFKNSVSSLKSYGVDWKVLGI